MAERTGEGSMRAYVGGDHAAFRELFGRYAPMLMRLTMQHLRSEELAREVVQQTFFQVRGAERLQADRKLRPWVFTIAMNLVREHYRKKKRRPTTELDEAREATPWTSGARGSASVSRRCARRWKRTAAKPAQGGRAPLVRGSALRQEDRPDRQAEGAVRVRAHRAATSSTRLPKELG
ncbi:MAG: sigma factor [Sandaracinaceae bacterium]